MQCAPSWRRRSALATTGGGHRDQVSLEPSVFAVAETLDGAAQGPAVGGQVRWAKRAWCGSTHCKQAIPLTAGSEAEAQRVAQLPTGWCVGPSLTC